MLHIVLCFMRSKNVCLLNLLIQVRSQAAGIRWPVQAHLEEEGQDYQEAGSEAGVYRVQVEESGEFYIPLLSQIIDLMHNFSSPEF